MTVAAERPETSRAAAANDLKSRLSVLREAARKGGAPAYGDRLRTLEKLEKTLLARKDTIAQTVARDFGNRSRHETLFAEVYGVLGAIRYTKEHLRDWMDPEDRETSWVFLPSTSQVISQPLGVVGIIAPWNYPILLALGPLVAALAAGNRVMIKPSELVPETSELLRDLAAEAFAADQVAVVTGGPEVGEAFSGLPFDHLLFTGSTRIGRMVMRAASEHLVPVTLELGGKSPAIVGADFDVPCAAARIIAGKTYNAGQTCIAPDFVMVPAAARGAFVDGCKAAFSRMYGSIRNNPDYTSIVNGGHYARLRGYVDDARASGAEVVELGAAGDGDATDRKMAPTLVLGASDSMRCMQEEIFGPVLPVLTYGALEEAIAYVNDHPRPLALYYFGHDRRAIERVLSETISGGVTINETMLHIAQDDLPFGGVGPSGMGHYHSREGFDAFSKKKPVFHQSRINTTGLLRPPYGKLADRVLRLLLGR